LGEIDIGKRVHGLLRSLNDLAGSDIDATAFRWAVRDAKHELLDCLQAHGRSECAAQLLVLKTLNLLVAKRDMTRRSLQVDAQPLGLIVDPSNGCNLACPGCVHSQNVKRMGRFDWSPGMMPEDRMGRLIKRFGPFASHVFFYNYGEPLLNPRTPEYIRMAKRTLARTVVSTNLSLKKFDAEAYVASGLDFMTLSIDGTTQETYARYRRGGDLDLVLANVEKLVEAKRRLGRSTPVLNWQFLVFEHNRHQMDRAEELARAMGVNQITLGHPFRVDWDDPSIVVANGIDTRTVVFDAVPVSMSDDMQTFEAEVDASATARIFEEAWAGEAATDLEASEPGPSTGTPCHWLYKNMVVDTHGRVMPCCAPPGRDYDIVYASFGADDQGSDPFNSSKYALARLSFRDAGAFQAGVQRAGLEPPPHCAACKWGQGRRDVNVSPEDAASYLGECTRGLIDGDGCKILGDW